MDMFWTEIVIVVILFVLITIVGMTWFYSTNKVVETVLDKLHEFFISVLRST